MANTGRATLPYPVGTDKVRGGAAAIQALAAGIDPTLPIHLTALPSSSALSTAYPIGYSYKGITGADATADTGWPTGVGQSSNLLTLRTETDRVCQWCLYNGVSANAKTWYRAGSSTAWGPWMLMTGDIYRNVSGSATISVTDSAYTLATWSTTENNVGDIAIVTNYLQVATAGLYHITATTTWTGLTPAVPTAIVSMGLGNGGASDPLFRAYASAPSTGSLVISASWDRPMAAGDNVGLFLFHTQGVVRSVAARRLTIRRVGN